MADQNLINALASQKLPANHMFNQVANRLQQHDGSLEALFRTTPGFDPVQTYSRSTPTALIDAVMGGDKRVQDQAAFLGQFPNAQTYDPPVEPAFMGMDTVTSAIVPRVAKAYGNQVLKNAPEIAERTTRAASGGLVGMKPTMDMRGYHGSPHKFDEFSLDHIGKGEGVQAYGHGLYFAENPTVAGMYQDLTDGGMLINGKKINLDDAALPDKILYVKRAYENAGGDPEKAIKALRSGAKNMSEYGGVQHEYTKAADWLQKHQNKLSIDQGHMYEVDIPDEHVKNFLDWDAPLSEQHENIQDALKSMVDQSNPFTTRPSYDGRRIDVFGPDMFQMGSVEKYELQSALENFKQGFFRNNTAGDLYKALSRASSKKEISEKLNNFGIKGIKYFDGNSRAAGEGTRNLVVFDDSIVQTIKRNDEDIIPKSLQRQSEMHADPNYKKPSSGQSTDAFSMEKGSTAKPLTQEELSDYLQGAIDEGDPQKILDLINQQQK